MTRIRAIIDNRYLGSSNLLTLFIYHICEQLWLHPFTNKAVTICFRITSAFFIKPNFSSPSIYSDDNSLIFEDISTRCVALSLI